MDATQGSCTRAGASDTEDGLKSRWNAFHAAAGPGKSNVREHRDGAHIYENFVKPTVVDLQKVGAHYAISSLFQSYPDEARILLLYRPPERFPGARRRQATAGHRTRDLHVGDHAGIGAVVLRRAAFRRSQSARRRARVPGRRRISRSSCSEAMPKRSRAPISPDVIRAFDRGFGTDTYSLEIAVP